MSKSIRIQEPSEEMCQKIIRARVAISTQRQRYLLCPYCRHKSIAVFEDNLSYKGYGIKSPVAFSIFRV